MARRFKRVESRVESLALRDLHSRLSLALVELAEDFGREVGGEVLIDLPLSQHDLATLVGASRQSVNQCLRDLRATRRIAYRNQRIALLDPAELRREAARSRACLAEARSTRAVGAFPPRTAASSRDPRARRLACQTWER
jgi:hypothetical protein